jgi:predicted site-specific integrase-resolvase
MSRKNPKPAEREAAELDRTRTLAERHKVSIRTIERWCEAGILPQPLRIRGRKFWPRGTVARLDDATP